MAEVLSIGAGVAKVIISIIEEIVQIADQVKANKRRCKRLADRLNALVPVLLHIEELDPDVKKEYDNPLRQLHEYVKEAETFINKFRDLSFLKSIWKRGDIKDKFEDLNERLDNVKSSLSLGLTVDTINKIDSQRKSEEDKEDALHDLENLLDELGEGQQNIKEGVEENRQLIEDNGKLIKQLLKEVDERRTNDSGSTAGHCQQLAQGESYPPAMQDRHMMMPAGMHPQTGGAAIYQQGQRGLTIINVTGGAEHGINFQVGDGNVMNINRN
ncbi:mixed lineage kinase domain-like protein [Ptychodera flava]|uniref:mixed lineage kinase domain-like protein n=1 Tax=Ptychodera flava TaxID=63121 RepID=UPI003969F1B1